MDETTEEAKRTALTVTAAGLWALAAAYALFVAVRWLPLACGFADIPLAAAAATVSVVRLAKSNRYVLAQVYRAGVESERDALDVDKARSFSAGVEIGKLLPEEESRGKDEPQG
jgi:hypothetical protein